MNYSNGQELGCRLFNLSEKGYLLFFFCKMLGKIPIESVNIQQDSCLARFSQFCCNTSHHLSANMQGKRCKEGDNHPSSHIPLQPPSHKLETAADRDRRTLPRSRLKREKEKGLRRPLNTRVGFTGWGGSQSIRPLQRRSLYTGSSEGCSVTL